MLAWVQMHMCVQVFGGWKRLGVISLAQPTSFYCCLKQGLSLVWNLQIAWAGQTNSPERFSISPPAFLLLIQPVFGDCSLVIRADPYKDWYDIRRQDGKSITLAAPIEY